MRPIIAAALISISPAVASADLPLDCAKAIALNRVEDVRRIAGQLAEKGGQYSHISLGNAFDCLESATGVIHTYDRKTQMFAPEQEANDLKMKTEAEQRQADKEALDGFEEAQREIARQDAHRKRLVYLQLVESCENMYRRKPDETITNKLCFDVFMSNGLPES